VREGHGIRADAERDMKRPAVAPGGAERGGVEPADPIAPQDLHFPTEREAEKPEHDDAAELEPAGPSGRVSAAGRGMPHRSAVTPPGGLWVDSHQYEPLQFGAADV
jgi:hypothetical protein